MVHIPGAVEPGTPASPEFIKAHVYIPGTIVTEMERGGGLNTVPDLLQVIIRELGVPTLTRFNRLRKKFWKFASQLTVPRTRPLPIVVGMPVPIPSGSARYTFYGRRFESREAKYPEGSSTRSEWPKDKAIQPDCDRESTLSSFHLV